jgi:hypothetical protein
MSVVMKGLQSGGALLRSVTTGNIMLERSKEPAAVRITSFHEALTA